MCRAGPRGPRTPWLDSADSLAGKSFDSYSWKFAVQTRGSSFVHLSHRDADCRPISSESRPRSRQRQCRAPPSRRSPFSRLPEIRLTVYDHVQILLRSQGTCSFSPRWHSWASSSSRSVLGLGCRTCSTPWLPASSATCACPRARQTRALRYAISPGARHSPPRPLRIRLRGQPPHDATQIQHYPLPPTSRRTCAASTARTRRA